MVQVQFARLALITVCITILVSCGLVSNSGSAAGSSIAVTSIALAPLNSAVSVGQTLQLQATATFSDGSQKDISSTAIWGTSNTALATVSAGLVKGVSSGVIQVQAASGSVSASTLLNVTNKTFNRGSLKGRYAFKITGNDAQGLRVETGSIAADGNGNVSGVEDIHTDAGLKTAISISGTYSISADGRGTLKINSGSGTRSMRFVVSENSSTPGDTNASLIESDATLTATGILEKQDTSSFQNASLASSTYVFRFGGLDSGKNPIATIGFFKTDPSGRTITGGTEDVNDNGTINGGSVSGNPISISSGTFGAPDPTTGRVQLNVTSSDTAQLAGYMISASKIELIGLDSSTLVAGVAEKQSNPTPSSLGAGGYVFLTDIGGLPGQFWIAGQFQVDNTAHIVGLAQYQDGGITLNTGAPAGTITTSSSGRGILVENTSDGARDFTFYMVSTSRLYLLQTNDAHAGAGAADMQQPGPDGFGLGTLDNSLAIGAAEVGDGNSTFVAQVVADGFGGLNGIEDLSEPQPGNPAKLVVSSSPLIANYSPPNAGGVTVANVSTSGTAAETLVLFFIAPNKALILGLNPGDQDGTVALQ